jgi:hypothetical protein
MPHGRMSQINAIVMDMVQMNMLRSLPPRGVEPVSIFIYVRIACDRPPPGGRPA